MPNPKKNHVRYVRRIPAGFVAKMDAHLKSLRETPEPSEAVKKVLAMTEESAKRMGHYSRRMRQDLEAQARTIASAMPQAASQPSVPAKDYSINFLKTK